MLAENPAQRFDSTFTAQGVSIATSKAHIALSLAAVSYGGLVEPLAATRPREAENRATFRYSGITARYANGPAGLEQSFTIAKPKTRSATRTVAVSMLVSGDATATLLGGRAVAFAYHGKQVLRYGGVSATDASGRGLRTVLGLRGDRLVLAIDTTGARYPISVDPLVQQGEKLTPSPVGSGFGWSVAISADGNTVIVGSPYESGERGAAWIFVRSGSTWAQQGGLLSGGKEEVGGAQFGMSVALSANGSTAIVGAPYDNSIRGAAWVFTRSGATWTQQGEKLTGAEEVGRVGQFGWSVALSASGDTALVGGRGDNSYRGAAWVFTRSEGAWSQQGSKLKARNEETNAEFGSAVALSASGDTAALGGYDVAWVFTRVGEEWSQQATLDSAEEYRGGFGQSIALASEANTLLVGVPAATVSGISEGGEAVPYVEHDGTWVQQGPPLVGSEEEAGGANGWSVALSANGDVALTSGYYADDDVGDAWVFERTGTTWEQAGAKLTAGGESGSGTFGHSAAISGEGTTAILGGPEDDNGRGAVWVFETPLATQTVTFTSSPEPAPIVGGSYTVSATGGGSGNPVTFSIYSGSTAGACSISENVVEFDAIGKCIIVANQEGNAHYLAAPQALQQITVAQAPQVVTFTSSPPAAPAVGTTYVVSATGGGSGNPLVYSINARGASTLGACTISGRTVSFVGGGYCTIEVTQAASANYQEGVGRQYLTVGPGAPPSFIAQWGSQGPGSGQFSGPVGIAINAVGDVYVSDAGNHRVEEFDPSGDFMTAWGSQGSGPGQFENPEGIAVNAAGDVYVADAGNSSRIEEFDGSGHFLREWGKKGSGPGEFESPRGLAIDSSGNVYATDYGNERVEKFTAAGEYLMSFGVEERGEKPGRLVAPWGVAVNSEGDVYVTSIGYFPINEFAPSGAYITRWPVRVGPDAEFIYPTGLGINASGDLFLANSADNLIDEYNGTGNLLTEWGEAGVGVGDFSSPVAVAVSDAGEIYVADHGNDRIERFSFGGGLLAQEIAFTTTPPAHPSVGGAYHVDANGGGSGEPVIFSVDQASTPGACTIMAREVTFTGVGQCIVDANQAGNASYESAPQASQTLAVALPPPPPISLATHAAIYLTRTSATLTASVDPNGVALTGCDFEYGTTEGYGQTVPCATEVPPGAASTEVRAALYGLTAGGSYHFRIVVHSSGGTVYGSDGAFRLLTHATTALSIEAPKYTPEGPASSFGERVAISADGTTALVSSAREGDRPEAVYVLARTLSGWTEQAELQPPEGVSAPPPSARFGSSFALSADGDTAIIGAEDDGGSGSAWVYTRLDGVWLPGPTKLVGDGATANAAFGSGVALSADGTRAVVGADADSGDVGAVFAFEDTGTGWQQQGAKIVAIGERGTGWFGKALALSAAGDTLVVGAPFDNGGVGAAWVYTRVGETWSQQGSELVGAGEVGNAIFGNAVAMSADGSTVMVAAPWDTLSATVAGAVYTFRKAGDQWLESGGRLLAGEEPEAPKADFFGWSLALSADGQTALIGSLDSNGVVGNVGAARLYNVREGHWAQQGARITGAGQLDQSNFGASVALSGDGGTALIGGPSDDDWVGAVWGFEAPAMAPSTTTGAAREASPRGATVQGLVTPDGRSVSECTFEYGPTAAYGSKAGCDTEPGGGVQPVEVAAQLTGLTPDTTYHFRLVATNSSGVSYGADASFATTGLATPAAVTAVPGKGEATISWSEPGEATPTTYTVTATDLTNGARGGQVATSSTTRAAIGDLTPGDTYAFTVVATDGEEASDESTASNAVTIEALAPVAPSATTEAAGEVGSTSATLTASVDPNGSAVTECRFDFGPTAAYGESVPCGGSVGAGTAPVQVSGHVVGLSGSSPYHFRVVVTNAAGTVYGDDMTFMTTSGAATITIDPATEIGPHSAVLNGTVDPNGSAMTACYFEYGTQQPFSSTVACATPQGGGSGVIAESAAVTGLRGRTSFEDRLVVVNGYGATDSALSEFSTSATGELESPSAVEAAAGVGSATVSWQAPYETGNSPIATYTVTATDVTSPAHGGQTATVIGSPAVISGLQGGDVYTFTVVANNVAGASSPASEASNGVLVWEAPAITSPASASIGMRSAVDIVVAATGTPTPSLSEAGTLPAGVTITNNEDGTATFSGSAAAGTAGTYPIVITAENETGETATQHFVLTVTTATSAPSITSETETEQALDLPFTYTVTTNGYPAPTLTKTGALPAGVTFTNNGDGTATIAGTPTVDGSFTIKVSAKSAAGAAAQNITITVTAVPVFAKISTTKAAVGSPLSLKVKAKGYLPPTFSMPDLGYNGLPPGLELMNEGEGTALIAGTPALHSGGLYAPVVLAVNASGQATDTFTLEVREVPVITSTAAAAVDVAEAASVRFAASGFPAPAITRTGALPKGMTYLAANRELAGTPKAGTEGTYPMTVTAKNTAGSVKQQFVLTVR